MLEIYEKIAKALIFGNQNDVIQFTEKALKEGAVAKEILDKGLLGGMDVVGKRFKEGELFIPEVLQCASCMHRAMEILRPLLSESDAAGAGIYVLGTVEGDVHDIGKNLVSMMLQGAGFKVVDLGINVTAQKFVEAVKEHKPKILGMSALLTTTMPKMEETITAIKEAGIRNQIKIMAGGAPVTWDFVNKIGADAYAANAALAVEKAKELI